jgi:hypothetical protein
VRALLSTRLAGVLRGLLRGGGFAETGGSGRNVMEAMVAERRIGAGSPLRESALREFRANLGAILDLAQAADVPVLLCTVASNLPRRPSDRRTGRASRRVRSSRRAWHQRGVR